MPRRVINILVVLGILATLVGVHLALSLRAFAALAPPEDVTSIRQFAATMPPPRRLAVIRDNGGQRIVWLGEAAGTWSLPSGPACYVFDENGALVDWTADSGEGGEVGRLADIARRNDATSLDEVLRQLPD